ncbi:MAG: 6,7-dimethyl-8-ribityllumazine synthase [Acidimicrobiia bacterium]|nr:6,7-dimethyl-8-ribityllumazine synthase [Acidimicrobiia bacterium]
MGQYYKGELSDSELADAKIAIIVSKFNEDITTKLLEGALEELKDNNIDEDKIEVMYVPGAFELGVTAKAAAEKGSDAVICLGAVIQGGTPHFEYVANTCALAISNVALNTGVPTIFGVLTVNNQEQAIERVGGKEGHKGKEAAATALEMISLLRSMKEEKSKKLTGFVS